MGNINSNLVRTLDGNRLQYLVGSGGANDVLSSARETVVICPSKGGLMRFVQQVPFSTGTGQKITTLITDQAVFRKVDDQLVLDQVIPPNSTEKDFEKLIKQVKKNTGWHPFITSDPVTICRRSNSVQFNAITIVRSSTQFSPLGNIELLK